LYVVAMSRIGGLIKTLGLTSRSSPCLKSIISPINSLVNTSQLVPRVNIHCTPIRMDLNEFFEIDKFRGEKTVRVGREWRKDELRLKSNTDLHKLWFILLKERNMLLTMADAYKEEFIAMPNPERIDKVELSMEHLEEVVRERNRAYYQLEVGVSGERERILRPDCFGRTVPYKKREHSLPFVLNSGYRRKLKFRFHNSGREDVLDFQARMRERDMYAQRGKENEQMRMAARVLRRFPHSDLTALQERFPLVQMDRLTRWKKVVGEKGTAGTGWDV